MIAVKDVSTVAKVREAFQLLSKTTCRGPILKAINMLERLGARWRPVGDRETNFATIYLSSNPEISAVERVTNSIDAVIEAVAEANPLLKKCKSPRNFVQEAFGVKRGELISLSEDKRKKLVEETGIVLTPHDGDFYETPTIDIQDAGIGLARKEFPLTILSLNRANKINKWYTMGRFGQGGATTFRFSDFTIIISRKRVSNLSNDQVSFTIVKFQRPLPSEKDGKYVYLVASDNLPFSIPAAQTSFQYGTLVRHINYRFGKKYFIDLYSSLQMLLFDPVLPFWLCEGRSGSNKGERRRIFGSRDRLGRSDLVEDFDETLVPLGNDGELGNLVIRWWVFKLRTQTKQKMTFIDPDNPIIITYLGQTHAILPRRILHTNCGFAYLYKDLVIQIDCDEISDKGRRVIFTSTREVVTKEGNDLLRQALIDALSQEEALREIDWKRQEQFLKEGITKETEEMRRKLAEMINRIKPGTFRMPTGKDKGPWKRPSKRGKSRKHKEPLPTKEFPTFILIANKADPIKFRNTRNTRIELESDAEDGFLEKFKESAMLAVCGDALKYTQIVSRHRDFKGGRLYLNVRLIGDHPVGTEFQFGIKLQVINPHLTELVDTRRGIVTQEMLTGGDRSKVLLDAPRIISVMPEDSFWEANEWTEDNVAEVREDTGTDIYVSLGNKWYVGTIVRSSYGEVHKELLKNRFVLHIAFHAYLQYLGLKDTSADIPQTTLDEIKQQELERAARTILTAATSERAFDKVDVE